MKLSLTMVSCPRMSAAEFGLTFSGFLAISDAFCDGGGCRRMHEWWKGRDSNPRPRHYECRALTG